MAAALAPAALDSIGRVLDVLEVEADAMSGTPLAVLWSDWQDALSKLHPKRESITEGV